jgi:hypothetical protein
MIYIDRYFRFILGMLNIIRYVILFFDTVVFIILKCGDNYT